jgi:hypothetical protein
VEAVVEPRSARVGSSATVSVRFRLAAGAYLVAHQPLPEGTSRRDASDLLPLAVAFPGSSGLKLGSPDYPAGAPVVLAGSAARILAHAAAGEAPAAVVSARFTVPAGRAGDQRLRVRVSFQVCGPSGCAAPDSALVEAPFAVLP